MSQPNWKLPHLSASIAKVYDYLGYAAARSSLLAGLILFVLMVAAVVDIVSVQSFGVAIYEMWEIVVAFLVLVVWLSIPHVEHRHAQISAKFLYNRMPLLWQKGVEFLSSFVGLGLSGILSYLATVRVIRAFEMGELLPYGGYIPLSYIRLGFTIGIYLLTAVCLAKCVHIVLGGGLPKSTR